MQGRYDADHVLKVGDAASDFQAAKDNHVLFYPIIPGTETESWEKLGTEILHSFPAGEYKGTAMDKRVEQFLNALPEEPNW